MIDVEGTFSSVFPGHRPEATASAPGRINLIGEHTDYNGGFVLPAAIDRRIQAAGARTDDGRFHVRSLDYEGEAVFDLRSAAKSGDWSDTAKGMVLTCLGREREDAGARILVGGDVPTAAGLSSSAATLVSIGALLDSLFGLGLAPKAIALLAQRTEHEFVGIKSGIMDQFTSALGARDHALFLDCRSLDYRLVPFDGSAVRPVVLNTTVKRELAASKYNERRAECEAAAAAIRAFDPEVRDLRDATMDHVRRIEGRVPLPVFHRARHIVTEDARVEEAVRALTRGDMPRLGDLLAESHRSLQRDYEVSCRELDVLVEWSWKRPEVVGARMTGAGFGGCAIALVTPEGLESYLRDVAAMYRRETGLPGEFYAVRIDDGVRVKRSVA